MQDDSSQPAARTEPTDVRFTTRGLLMVMVAVALAAAALGPYFRSLSADKRGPAALLWGMCWMIVLAWIFFLSRARYQLEGQAGRTLLALPPRRRFFPGGGPWISIAGGAIWVAAGLFYLMIATEDLDRQQGLVSQLAFSFYRGIFCAMFISLGIAAVWWSRKVQLREHGVLRGLNLLLWGNITRHEWQNGSLSVEGVNQRHADARVTMNVPAQLRHEVDSILVEHLRVRVRQIPGSMASAPPTVVALPPIEITTNQLSRRGCLTLVAAYVLVIMVVAFRPWGTPPREFNVGAGVGFFGALLTGIFKRVRDNAAGAPLVRLPIQTDWLRIAASTALAICLYYMAQHFDLMHPLLPGAMGCICGVCLFSIFTSLFRQKLDLCENGVVIVWWSYWPWESMRVSRWKPEKDNRLTLTHGWRRVIAIVLTGESATVDAILREKIPRAVDV